jgi:hypothetical protein
VKDDLPIHFFTIVLNGQPFIRHQIDVFRALPFRWHWHVIEGVAELAHDTAWSLAEGGRIDASLHRDGLSNDGTTEYLDRIARAFPGSVTLYRKTSGRFWDGKREMVQAPLASVTEPCLLFEVDSDELWRPEQIVAIRNLFHAEPHRTAAYYWCDYFVAPDIVISTRYNYAQNPTVEWLRTWRFEPGMHWLAHEPPTLVQPGPFGRVRDVAKIAPFTHDETESVGARFQHFSYGTEEQMQFKQIYYAQGDVQNWRKMNAELSRSKFLREYFPWIGDTTMIDRAARAGVVPWAEPSGDDWRFLSSEEIGERHLRRRSEAPTIVIDLTLSPAAPSRVNEVWIALLREWWATSFCDRVVLLDRGGWTTRLPGLRYRSIPLSSTNEPDLLQRVCDEFGATLFLSARASAPRKTVSAMLHGLGDASAVPSMSDRSTVHFVGSEAEKRRLLEAHPSLAQQRVITVQLGASQPGTGSPTLEQALRDLASRV